VESKDFLKHMSFEDGLMWNLNKAPEENPFGKCSFKDISNLLKELEQSIPHMKDTYDTLQEFFSDVIKCGINVTVSSSEYIEADKIVICKSQPYSASRDRVVYCNPKNLDFFKKIKSDGIMGVQLIVLEEKN